MAAVCSRAFALSAGQRPSPRAAKATSFRGMSLSSKTSVAPNFSHLKRVSALQIGRVAAGSRSTLHVSAKKIQWPEAFEYLDDVKVRLTITFQLELPLKKCATHFGTLYATTAGL
eukprot:1186117-Prorocentrum_minimum.AAC.5